MDWCSGLSVLLKPDSIVFDSDAGRYKLDTLEESFDSDETVS